MRSIDITDYYDYATLSQKLDDLVASAPDLVAKESIATTPAGRDVWALTIANEDAGPALDRRPALLLSANLHAPELAGSWVALHFIRCLVESYPSDPAVGQALDEQVFYVIPRIAPDGAEVALERRGKIVRSRFIEANPDDIYEANVVAPRDLTGDGRIVQMRWPDEDGEMVPIEEGEPAMVSWDPDADGAAETTRYRVVTEGDVVNYDGGEVRDPHYGFRRSDFNRNFPTEGWTPLDLEGHGRYPLSEPETRGVAEFLYERPNITAVLDLHTGNPAIFYPATLAGDEPMHRSDADMLRNIGENGEEITGFSYVWGYGEFRGNEPRTELPGSFKDFAYERLGIPSLLIELGMLYNYLGIDAEDMSMDRTELRHERVRRLLDYQTEQPDRPVYHEWEPYDHPELGRVEIGGLDRTTHANPPPAEMPDIAESVSEFALTFASYHPDVRLTDVDVAPLGADLYRISATAVNRGRLPTNLTAQGQATNTRIPDRPRIEMTFEGDGEVITGQRRDKLDHLDANGGRQELEWAVRAAGPTSIDIEIDAARGTHAVERIAIE